MAVRAMRAGAFDFIEKPFSDQALLERIRQALDVDLENRAAQRRLEQFRERYARLSGREREVFGIVVTGQPNKAIASQLGLSQKTIEVHRAHVMEKMEARSLANLVKMAVELGITTAEV